jgi:phytoene dehydrogenase-like protein
MNRDESTTPSPVVVIGGGLAGLAAAATAARAGHPVRCLEAAPSPGGRARTTEPVPGYRFNLGPHALYRSGPGVRVLGELGVGVSGRKAPAAGLGLRRGRVGSLPAGLWSLVRTDLLDRREKMAFAGALAGLHRHDPGNLVGSTVGDWIARTTEVPAVRELLAAFVRLTSYADAPDTMDAGAAVAQLQMGSRAGVLYVDKGWSRLVDGLTHTLESAGSRVETRTAVRGVELDSNGGVAGVRLDDGELVAAAAVVLAVPPGVAQRLAPPSQTLDVAVDRRHPVRVACLDVASSRPWPSGSSSFLLGVDEPVYLSVHSETADLAPPGGALVHVARYLTPDDDGRTTAQRDALEATLERLDPDWRRANAHARFLPLATVAQDLPRAIHGGLAGRAPVAVPDVPGLFLAGDWVGAEGLLADAALASGQAAGRAAHRHLARRGPPRAGAIEEGAYAA